MTLGKIEKQQDLIDLFYRMSGLSSAIEQILSSSNVPADTSFAIAQIALTIHEISGFLTDEAEKGAVLFDQEGDR